MGEKLQIGFSYNVKSKIFFNHLQGLKYVLVVHPKRKKKKMELCIGCNLSMMRANYAN